MTRYLPLIVLVAALGVIFGMGWHTALIREIGLNLETIQAFVADNRVLALVMFGLAYAAAVVLVPPAGSIMTIGGGLVFGALYAVPATVLGATLGATILFLIVKTSLGEALAKQAGAWVDKLRGGFQENALSYMLFLRLVPAFPFFVVNVVPGLLGVPLRTYVIGTLIGIIPGTTAYSLLGEGAGSIFEEANTNYQACVAQNGADGCTYSISFANLVTPELVMAFGALAVVALLPMVIKRFSGRKQAAPAAQ
ncbi:MAG: TVP38/TMEM64 family protein [Pseudomonadota bacterium]